MRILKLFCRQPNLLKCKRCKKTIKHGKHVNYQYAYPFAEHHPSPYCAKCAGAASFSIEYRLTSDGHIFDFADISDELIKIDVWIEKNGGDICLKRKTHYLADNSTETIQRIVRPRNLSEVLCELQHLCREILLDSDLLKTNADLLLYLFDTQDPDVYIPRLLNPAFSSYDVKSMSRIDRIKMDGHYLDCSIESTHPLSIKIGGVHYSYTRKECVHLSSGYNHIEIVLLNDDEYYLYYEEHPSKGDILGWSIYTLTKKEYEQLKFGTEPQGGPCRDESLLGDLYLSSDMQCVPYVIAALSHKRRIASSGSGIFLK